MAGERVPSARPPGNTPAQAAVGYGSCGGPLVVAIGNEQLPLADFLICCAESLQSNGTVTVPNPELIGVRDSFLSAGIAALRKMSSGLVWLQYGLVLGPERRAELYAKLDGIACELLAEKDISEFFFMHKPPGMRVRFETAGPHRSRLEAVLQNRLRALSREGLIEQWHPAVYEPEAYLFGGPVSMRSVHRLFTADSLAWLGYHKLAQDDTSDQLPGPVWAMSLVMVRVLFDVLDIVGWEDRDVWDRLRWQLGRQLRDDTSRDEGFARL